MFPLPPTGRQPVQRRAEYDRVPGVRLTSSARAPTFGKDCARREDCWTLLEQPDQDSWNSPLLSLTTPVTTLDTRAAISVSIFLIFILNCIDIEKAGLINRSRPFSYFLVRMRGLEPPRCLHHRLLRPARLPVPPHPLICGGLLCERVQKVSRMWKYYLRRTEVTGNLALAMPVSAPIVLAEDSNSSGSSEVSSPWSTTVPATLASVMTVNELATLFAQATV